MGCATAADSRPPMDERERHDSRTAADWESSQDDTTWATSMKTMTWATNATTTWIGNRCPAA